MLKDPLRGKAYDFVFTDGQMAGKTFTHAFANDGTVTFYKAGSKRESGVHEQAPRAGVKYTFSPIRDRIYAVSYRSDAGYTLTAILDFETRRLVAFVSNAEMNEVAQGIFEDNHSATTRKNERSEERISTHG